MRNPDTQLVRDALVNTLRELGLENGGYDADWVWIEVGPFSFPLPNSGGRKAVVQMHDLHHLATGYRMDLRGEGEIAAFELAAGCERFPTAWILNMMAFTTGLLVAPRRTYRAFLRGRRAETLYNVGFDHELLDRPLRDLRDRLGVLREAREAEVADRLAFVLHAIVGLTGLVLPPAAALAITAGMFWPVAETIPVARVET